MSSENLGLQDQTHYLWHHALQAEAYAVASYVLETTADPMLAALAIAREQSATTPTPPMGSSRLLSEATARVMEVTVLGRGDTPLFSPYSLTTPIYPRADPVADSLRVLVRLAFPVVNWGAGVTAIWNGVWGELHRLGFITALRLIGLTLPPGLLQTFPGPRYGVAGLRQQLGIEGRPLFCRSTRPAVGLTTGEMVQVNRAVLQGGFDMVKDDELTCHTPLSPFPQRVQQMAQLVAELGRTTGEKKFYIANAIDDPLSALEWSRIAAANGADGLLIAPGLQGIGLVGALRQRTTLALLAHNVGEDSLTRHPRQGVHPAVLFFLHRLAGADMIMMPGPFASGGLDPVEEQACLAACRDPLPGIAAALPVVAGGKRPDTLPGITRVVGNQDYMVIVASAVDLHPDGVAAAARSFRLACLDKGER